MPIDFTIYDITLDGPNHTNPVYHDPFHRIYSGDLDVVFDAYKETGFDATFYGGPSSNPTHYIKVTEDDETPVFDSNDFEVALDRMIAEGHVKDKVFLYIQPNVTWIEIYQIVKDPLKFLMIIQRFPGTELYWNRFLPIW